MNFNGKYHESDEITFLRGLATGSASAAHVATTSGWCGRGANVSAFRRYAAIILNDERVWDPGVDVARIQRETRALLKFVDFTAGGTLS